MDVTLVTMEDDTKNCNTVKELILDKLCKDGIITEEQFNEYNVNHQVIIVKNSWFKQMCEKLKLNESSYVYRYVKFN